MNSFLCRRRFITTHQESIIHAKGARGGCSSSVWYVRARATRGGGGGENNIRLFRQNELCYCIQP